MPEKERKGDSVLHQLKELLVTKFSTTVIENISLHIQDLMRKLQEAVYLTQKKIIQHFYVAGLFTAACVLLIISGLFYLMDTLQWSRTKATFVAGIILLAASFLMRQYVVKTRTIRGE